MKESLFDALTRQTSVEEASPMVDRRSFVKFGAAAMGVLGGASAAQAFFPRLFPQPVVPEGPPLLQLPPPQPEIPPPLPRLTFEASCGVYPQHMHRLLQEYIALTLSPEWAAQIVQAQIVPPTVTTSFHQTYWSDYRFVGQIPVMRTRYGFYTCVNQLVMSDGQPTIRAYQDLNFFELRRVINASEMATFGTPLIPYTYRRAPVQADVDAFYRVSRQFYGITNPETYTIVYVRQLTNGRQVFNSYLIARGPEPMRSPFKDLLIDNVPVVG